MHTFVFCCYTFVLALINLQAHCQSRSSLDRIKFIQSTYGKNLTVFAVERGLLQFDSNFSLFLKKYNKQYLQQEEIEYRKGNFLYSLDLVTASNKECDGGRIPYRLSINRFADYGMNENYLVGQKFINAKFIQAHAAAPASIIGGSNPATSSKGNAPSISAATSAEGSSFPESFDWISQGMVTPVQDQGQCGSCWIFAPLTVVESVNAIAKNPLVKLSVQQMMDCVKPPNYVSNGCQGGTADDVYSFVQQFGAVAEQGYPPYSQTVGSCQNVTGRWGEWITMYNFLQINATDQQIMWALYNYGPVASIINAGDMEFQLYSGGVFTSPGSRNLYGDYNHYITIVGWGNEGGYDYWLIQNSWGTDWGEGGLMKMLRGINSHGINTLVSYAAAIQQPYNQTVINNNNSTNNNNNSAQSYYRYRFHWFMYLFVIIVGLFQS